ncbi:MAG: DUF2141 domain-containing protein [Phormidesmis sp.]
MRLPFSLLSYLPVCLLSLLGWAAFPIYSASAQLPTSSNLTVEITGLESAEGQVCLSLFSSRNGFPDDAESVAAKQCVPAIETDPLEAAVPAKDKPADRLSGTMTAVAPGETATDEVVITAAVLAVTFKDLAPGTYAIAVIHDENEDGELNTGIFSIPTEGFGFSRNPIIGTSAPNFSEAAVVVFGRETSTAVEMIYY